MTTLSDLGNVRLVRPRARAQLSIKRLTGIRIGMVIVMIACVVFRGSCVLTALAPKDPLDDEAVKPTPSPMTSQ